MRVMITGAGGFVGHHLVRALGRVCPSAEIVAMSRALGTAQRPGYSIEALDVTDRGAVMATIERLKPDSIVHLAGIASPHIAVKYPEAAWKVHVGGTINLADAIMSHAPNCWLMFVGSGMVYGATARSGLPLAETATLDPLDEYGVTKAAADLALGALARRGLNCIRFRPFNHTGPGQSPAFATPSFAAQIARIEAGLQPPVIRVGNLDAERDLLDVRDVVNAYALAVSRTDTLSSGMILNIASGVPRRIGDLLGGLLAMSEAKILVEQDPERMRPNDIPRMIGDGQAARANLGWAPEIELFETLADVLDDFRSRVAIEARSDRSGAEKK